MKKFYLVALKLKLLKVCKTKKKNFVDDFLIVNRLKKKKRGKSIKYIFQIYCVASRLFYCNFSWLMKQFIFVKVLKVVPGKGSTDINKVLFHGICFDDKAPLDKLKTTIFCYWYECL